MPLSCRLYAEGMHRFLEGLSTYSRRRLTQAQRPDVDRIDQRFAGQRPVAAALRPVDEVGLGYLRLGEPTPSLSGGESQRLRIASRLRSSQRGALYVFDEPSTGLHPLDVATLTGVFDRLLEAGATVIVIDHDLDLIGAAGSSTWAPAAVPTAATSSPPGRPKLWPGTRPASPVPGWPSTSGSDERAAHPRPLR